MTGSTETLPTLYSLPSYVFNDITTGFNGYNAGPGYDLLTGLGSPKAPLVVSGLGGAVASGGLSYSGAKAMLTNPQIIALFENSGAISTKVSVNWGDGSPATAGTIVGPNSTGLYEVEGTHAYANQGIYTITVNISFGPSAGVAVKSTAAISYNIGILLLDRTGAGAFTSSGNGGIAVTGGGDIIINSSNAKAAIQSGGGNVSATVIDVVGKVVHSGAGSFVGPVQPEPADADPLATLAAPPSSGPTFKNTSISGKTVTLSPGTYVGGIHITGNSKVTLMPGVYILQGGGLAVSGSSSLSGSGVTIYNAPATSGDEINFSGTSTITLSAPTSGAYQGIVFFQNRASNAPVALGSGSVVVSLTGVVYAPAAPVTISGTAKITIQGDAANGISGALIAADLNKSGDGTLTVNASANTVGGSLPRLSA